MTAAKETHLATRQAPSRWILRIMQNVGYGILCSATAAYHGDGFMRHTIIDLTNYNWILYRFYDIADQCNFVQLFFYFRQLLGAIISLNK
jgi:hypothetical protein